MLGPLLLSFFTPPFISSPPMLLPSLPGENSTTWGDEIGLETRAGPEVALRLRRTRRRIAADSSSRRRLR